MRWQTPVVALSIFAGLASSETCPPPYGCTVCNSATIDSPQPQFPGQLMVAAVGDSLTFGRHASDRERDAYPSVLQRLLGDAYQVWNLGCSGSQVQTPPNRAVDKTSKDNPSYWTTSKFHTLNASQWDVVVLMLGTNDDVSGCNCDERQCGCNTTSPFLRDYNDIITTILTLGRDGTPPLVVLVAPPPSAHASCVHADGMHNVSGGVLVQSAAAQSEHHNLARNQMVQYLGRYYGLRVVDVTTSFTEPKIEDYLAAFDSGGACKFYCNHTEIATCRVAPQSNGCTCDHTHLSDFGYLSLATTISEALVDESRARGVTARTAGKRQVGAAGAEADAADLHGRRATATRGLQRALQADVS